MRTGFDLEEPMDFSQRLNKVISTSLKVADSPMREYVPKPKSEPEEEEEDEAEIEDEDEDEEEDEPSHSEL